MTKDIPLLFTENMTARHTGGLTNLRYSPVTFCREILTRAVWDLGLSAYSLARILGRERQDIYKWLSSRHYEGGNRPSQRMVNRLMYLYQLKLRGQFDPIYFDEPRFPVQQFWDDVEQKGIARVLKATEAKEAINA